MNEIKLIMEGTDFSFKKTITEQKAAQVMSLLSSTQSIVADGASRTTSTTKISARRAAGIREEVRALPIDTSLEGYPGYHELPLKADKIIWILQYAENNNITGLSSGEIDFLSTQMKERIESKNFGAFNNRNVRLSYVKKIGGLFQTQQKGLTYLKGLIPNNV